MNIAQMRQIGYVRLIQFQSPTEAVSGCSSRRTALIDLCPTQQRNVEAAYVCCYDDFDVSGTKVSDK